jgi:hypothetical protein
LSCFTRELAKKAGQKDSPKGHWDIVAFSTYEEAFGYMVGYEYHEMEEVLAIVDAVIAYHSGQYSFPSTYFIPNNIPPKSLNPPSPRNILSWSTMSTPSFVSTPSLTSTPSSKPHFSQSFSSNTPNRDIHLNISLSGLSLSPSSSTPKASFTNRGSHATSVNDSSPTCTRQSTKLSSSTRDWPVSPQKQLYGPIITLTRPMREFLRLYFGFTKDNMVNLSEILKAPSKHATLYPVLREMGMADEEIEFLTNWAFDSFPDHEKELGEEDGSENDEI